MRISWVTAVGKSVITASRVVIAAVNRAGIVDVVIAGEVGITTIGGVGVAGKVGITTVGITAVGKVGITTVGELAYACRENRLRDLDGFGAKTQENILAGIGSRANVSRSG